MPAPEAAGRRHDPPDKRKAAAPAGNRRDGTSRDSKKDTASSHDGASAVNDDLPLIDRLGIRHRTAIPRSWSPEALLDMDVRWHATGLPAIGSRRADAATTFEALCAQHCVSPDSIPDRPARQSAVGRAASAVALGKKAAPRSPDCEASRQRRRTLGTSGALPPELREEYTEGQQSVLAVIAGEVKRRGRCALPIDKIAALAGVCRRLVQYTLRKASRSFLLTVLERPQHGGKHLPHLITMLSHAWRDWIRRRPKARGEIGCTDVHPTKNSFIPKSQKPHTSTPIETPEDGFQRVHGRGQSPHDRRRCG